jgi:hypothetical protein
MCVIRTWLLLLAVAMSGASSFGAIENDPEGSVKRGGDGRYGYFVATPVTTTRTATTPQIPEELDVGHEPDFYGPNGAYWEARDEESQNRANTVSDTGYSNDADDMISQGDGDGSSLPHSSEPFEDNGMYEPQPVLTTAASIEQKRSKSIKGEKRHGLASGRPNNRRLRRRDQKMRR